MEIQNLNRLNDALFKAVFGSDTEITLSLINSVLSYQGTPTFQTVDFIDRELDPVEEEGKGSRLDLVGKEFSTGAKVNLEVQVVKQKYFGKRSLYYWSRLYNDLKRGDEYENLTRTVTINILDFILFEDEKEASNWYSCFGIYDKKTWKQLTDDFEMHFVELPKWSIQKSIKDMNSLERWVSYFDKKTTKTEMEEIIMQEPMVKNAVRKECLFTQDEIMRRKYDLIEKAERDRRGQIAYALEQGFNQGVEKGREQGMEKGREQGVEQLSTLYKFMVNDGKVDEIPQVMTDKKLREQYFKLYNIV